MFELLKSTMTLTNPFHNKIFAKFQLDSGKAAQIHTLKNKEGKEFLVFEMHLFKKFCIFYTYDYSPTLNSLAKKKNAIYTLIESYDEIKIPKSQKIFKSIKSIIPRHTNIINLSNSEEEIFNKMHPKGRYNIRLATKKGIIIQEETDIFNFYQILKETAERDKFYLNSFEYYESMLRTLGKHAKLFMAYAQNVPVAGMLNTYFKNTATYYYGASSSAHRNLMAPYLLQWHAIKDAKLNGYEYYDFLGVADPSNPKDLLKGVTYFKQKFGGEYTKWPDSITVVHNPFLFALLKIKKLLQF